MSTESIYPSHGPFEHADEGYVWADIGTGNRWHLVIASGHDDDCVLKFVHDDFEDNAAAYEDRPFWAAIAPPSLPHENENAAYVIIGNGGRRSTLTTAYLDDLDPFYEASRFICAKAFDGSLRGGAQ